MIYKFESYKALDEYLLCILPYGTEKFISLVNDYSFTHGNLYKLHHNDFPGPRGVFTEYHVEDNDGSLARVYKSIKDKHTFEFRDGVGLFTTDQSLKDYHTRKASERFDL